MARTAFISLLLLLQLVHFPAAAPGQLAEAASPAGPFASGQILVRFRSGIAPRALPAVARQFELSLSHEIGPGAADGEAVRVYQVRPGTELAAAAALQADPSVAFAEPDFLAFASETVPDDTFYGVQWALPKINAPSAWDTSTGSVSVTVAVVDTGVDLDHPDLAGQLVAGYDYVNDDASADDDNGHGTHVAGIIAAATNNGTGVAGLAWNTKIQPLKVLGANGSGTYSAISAAIYWAVDNGAHVINLSLGGSSYSSAMQAAVDYATANGVLVFAAAGNDFQNGNPVNYPAANSGVIGVAATDSSDAHASFSNTGSYVDIAAPGVSIASTYAKIAPNYYEYVYMSGTSMATPYAAGLAALVLAVNPALSPAQVQEILQNSAVDLGAPGRDDVFGHGRIDAAAALSQTLAAGATPTPTVTPTATAAPSQTGTPTPTGTASETATGTATQTATVTATPSATATATNPATVTPSPSATPSPTATPAATASSTATPTPSPSATATQTPTGTATASPTPTATDTATATVTASATPTPTATPTATPTVSPSATATASPTSSPTPSPSSTATFTPSPTGTPTATTTATATPTGTASPTRTPTQTATATATASPTPTPSATATATGTVTPPPTATSTATGTATATPEPTPTASSASPLPSLTASPTLSPTATGTASPTSTASPTASPTGTATETATATNTATATATPVVAAAVEIDTQPPVLAAGSGTFSRIRVRVLDAAGSPLAQIPVTFASDGAEPVRVETAADGYAQVKIEAGQNPGTETVHIRVGALSAAAVVETVAGAAVDASGSADTRLTFTPPDPAAPGLLVEIPADAVDEPTTFALTPVEEAPPTGPTLGFAGLTFHLNAFREGGYLGQFLFENPIRLDLGYTDEALGDLPEEELILSYREGDGWIDAATSCAPTSAYVRDPENNRISVEICHLSEFGLFAPVGQWLFLPAVQR